MTITITSTTSNEKSTTTVMENCSESSKIVVMRSSEQNDHHEHLVLEKRHEQQEQNSRENNHVSNAFTFVSITFVFLLLIIAICNDLFPKESSTNTDKLTIASMLLEKGNIAFQNMEYEHAITCYSNAIELTPNLADAWSQRGLAYLKAQSYAQALNDFNHALKLDSIHANTQNCMGVLHYYGYGVVTINYEIAFSWFEKAAKQGHAKAQHNVGLLYYYGCGTPETYTKAIEWFKSNPTAFFRFFDYLRDHSKALKWYEKAANQGHHEARYSVGHLYYRNQNYTMALEWLTKAANHNHSQAQYMLGTMYYNGDGVTQNYTIAFDWFFKSAQKEAYKWIKSAADQANLKALLLIPGQIDLTKVGKKLWSNEGSSKKKPYVML
ncbi:hypothetical protein FDP41_001462 [Naegleria fowleri]|uniref:Uncharacterized protein n=1 Tax=Naegleria fowleri TaxID=5763 RepID=A0A6A5BYS1_NAEFO|nr:uncharacterized protein FDP41_001462 [Naegleria fowleri]KAF0979484.1 hypothetical protein FDP41_001462 [Naegleria fowleri]